MLADSSAERDSLHSMFRLLWTDTKESYGTQSIAGEVNMILQLSKIRLCIHPYRIGVRSFFARDGLLLETLPILYVPLSLRHLIMLHMALLKIILISFSPRAEYMSNVPSMKLTIGGEYFGDL